MIIYEDFEVHDLLNPKLWDSAGQLLPEVRKGIVDTIRVFEQELQIPIDILDVQIVGSNASYNYTKNSDLDVHIIANFEQVSKEIELVKLVYDLQKSSFKKNHNITIKGIEVELYVQDVNSSCVSNGIYSVLDNQWVKEPKPLKSISKKDVSKQLDIWKSHIYKILKDEDEDEINNAINTLYLIRHNSVAAEGEYGRGNQLFKEIRSAGLLDKLKDTHTELVNKRLTVESLGSCGYSKGELINKLGDVNQL